MLFEPFRLTPHNSHYEGKYGEREMEWRRICAIDKANNLQSLLKNNHIETVLDVGCGTGSVLAEIARRGIGRKHWGIDMANPHLHADPSTHALELLQYDGTTLPFENQAFDLVYASHVIEHVPDPRGLIAEMRRVAKTSIYIEVPCELHCRTSQSALQSTLAIGHINCYSPESFLLLLQTSGLDVKSIEIFDHSLAVQRFHGTPIGSFLKKAMRGGALRINPRFASRLFTYHCGALSCP